MPIVCRDTAELLDYTGLVDQSVAFAITAKGRPDLIAGANTYLVMKASYTGGDGTTTVDLDYDISADGTRWINIADANIQAAAGNSGADEIAVEAAITPYVRVRSTAGGTAATAFTVYAALVTSYEITAAAV